MITFLNSIDTQLFLYLNSIHNAFLIQHLQFIEI